MRAVLYDEDDDLVDGDTGTVTISIWFEDNTVVIAPTLMTWNSLGTYTYLWNISNTASIGVYNIQINATFATNKFHVNREQCYVCDIISGE